MPLITENMINTEALEHFLRLCHTRSYPSKMTIIRPGDEGDKLLFILEGSVSVSVEDETATQLLPFAEIQAMRH